MSEALLIAFLGVALVIAVVVLFFNKKALVKRKLKKADKKKISSFRSGDVAKLVGQVTMIEEPLVAPLSGRKCAVYYVHVEEKISSGKSHHWRTLIEEEVWSKFVIKEGYKYAHINDKNLTTYIVEDRNYRSGFMNDASAKLERYLNSKTYHSENVLGFNKSIRYREGILEDGEHIAVFGKGVWKDAEELNLPHSYGKVLEITSTKKEAVYVSDDPDTTKQKLNDGYKHSRRYDGVSRYKR